MSSDNPDDPKTQLAAMFGRLAPEYDFAGCFKYFGQRLVDAAEVAPGHRVLDVACGRGAVLFPAAERVGATGQVEGVDLSEGMVQATKAEAEDWGAAVHVRLMVRSTWSFPTLISTAFCAASALCCFPIRFMA